MDWVNTALSLVGAVKPDIANQARESMKGITQDSNGLRKLLIQNGGKSFVDKAHTYSQNSPKILSMMKRFNIDPNVVKSIAYNALDTPVEVNDATSFSNKLDKYR